MSRYSSLHAFLIIFALFGSSVAAPEKHTVSSSGEGGSDGAGILSLTDIKNWRNKAGKGLSALGSKIGKLWKRESRWRDVIFVNVGDEKGIFKAELFEKTPLYCFYPYSILINGHTTKADPNLCRCVAAENVTNAKRDGTVVKFQRLHNRGEYTLIFANEEDAEDFAKDHRN